MGGKCVILFMMLNTLDILLQTSLACELQDINLFMVNPKKSNSETNSFNATPVYLQIWYICIFKDSLIIMEHHKFCFVYI